LLFGACIHDWEEWLPPNGTTPVGSSTGTETGTSTGSGTGTNTGTQTGGGGFGGGDVPGECPGSGLGSAALVKVATPQFTATCIDETEVTKGQYKAWLDTSPAPGDQTAPCTWNTEFLPQDAAWPPSVDDENLPVAGVSWCDAREYCEGVGKRLCGRINPPGAPLPTGVYSDYYESEWYNACTERGAHSLPYGGSYDVATCNGSDADSGGVVDVGSLAGCVTSVGVVDLSGNVWEWEDSCSGETGQNDNCRVRGGAFNAAAALMECAADLLQQRQMRNPALGFRCCADAVL